MKAGPLHALTLSAVIGLTPRVHAQNSTVARTFSDGQVREQVIYHKGQDTSRDTDSDGISDLLELQLGTDPAKADSDGDGTTDGIEVAHGLDPKSPNPNPDFVYIVNRLPSPPNYTDGALGSDISNTGIVTGSAITHSATSKDSAVRWNTVTGTVDVATNTVDSYGWAVNDNGAIAGKYNELALYWAPSSTVRSVNRDSSYTNYSSGINSSGKIVGSLNSHYPEDTGAFAWEDKGTDLGAYTHLPAPSGYRFPRAESINDRDQIIGVASNINTSQRTGVIWNGGIASIMPKASGAAEAAFDEVRSINRNGAVVGYKSYEPAVWTPTDGRKYLPKGPAGASDSAYAWDINAFGEVMGRIGTNPTIWRPDGSGGWDIIDVKSRILDPVVMTSFSPQGMNDAGQITGYYRELSKYVPVVLTPIMRPSLAVDANRDGVIKPASEDASDATSADKPHRFWVNDDDDNGGDINGDDTPGAASPDGQQVKVQGTRDLVDFFPVLLDLKQLLAVLPPSATVKYKLKNADDGLRFVYTNLSQADAYKYLKDSVTGNSLKDADAHWVTAAGYELDSIWLGQVKDADKGVILVEGRNATDKPLVLSVEKTDGTVIAEVKLDLRIVPVETMFRHLNLHDRNLAGLVGLKEDFALPEAMGDPTGFPDNPNSDSRWLIFVHGFNVSGQKARGWNAEMFKRCYWSRNKSRFIGVSWFGNPDPGSLGLPADYHLSMRNAMVTAPVLSQEINALPGAASIKTMFAHSLGCGVISSAIADHDMNIGRVCFVDAALARECFDGRSVSTFTSESDGMTPAAWKAYDSKLYAANWFNLFDPVTDARGKLTWNNRFTRTDGGQKDASPVVYHFYSSTEDVLAEYTGDLPSTLSGVAVLSWDGIPHGSFGWVWQEKGKGNRQNYGLGGPPLTHLGSYYAGWGFNLHDPLTSNLPKWYVPDPDRQRRVPKTQEEIGTVTNALLDGARYNPLFKTGWGRYDGANPAQEVIDTSIAFNDGPSWVLDLYGATSGSAVAADPIKKNQLLAEAIPSLTWCMGSHAVDRFEERNIPLPSLTDHWPRDELSGVPEWRHSDMREVAYLYQYRVFDMIITLSKKE